MYIRCEITSPSVDDEQLVCISGGGQSPICNTAKEIVEFVNKYNKKYSDMFTEGVIEKLQNVADYERIYGPLKRDALKVIDEFLAGK